MRVGVFLEVGGHAPFLVTCSFYLGVFGECTSERPDSLCFQLHTSEAPWQKGTILNYLLLDVLEDEK